MSITMHATDITTPTASHPIVDRERWLRQRTALLAREKALMREHDALARERQALPWVQIDEPYVFDTVDGPRTLAELFDGRRQLVMQHFMFGPGWEQGCPSCSYMADHIDGARPHLAQRDVSFVAVSRAPLADLQRFRARMGWQFPWVSSHGSDFNFHFGVSFTPEQLATGQVPYNYGLRPFPVEEAPGISVFVRDDGGTVFHAYSTYGRGVELMMGTYDLLDIVPRGRHEEGLPHTMAWVRHHDRYAPLNPPAAPAARAAGGAASSCCASGS